MKPNFFACCVKPCYLASSCLTHLPLVCGSIEYIYTVLKLLNARAFVLSLNTSSALKSLVCASCHSQEGPQNLACVVSPNLFPVLYFSSHTFFLFLHRQAFSFRDLTQVVPSALNSFLLVLHPQNYKSFRSQLLGQLP